VNFVKKKIKRLLKLAVTPFTRQWRNIHRNAKYFYSTLGDHIKNSDTIFILGRAVFKKTA
jgi:hypothetical protein